jgi:hypothetical protein
MYIFAESASDRPLEAVVHLPKPVNLGDRTWYVALMESTLQHEGSKTLRIHISADCVGVSILNGLCTGLLRIVDIEPRSSGSVEYVNPYPIKVNQPVLNAIRVTLTSPDQGDLTTIKGFRCVLRLSDDE